MLASNRSTKRLGRESKLFFSLVNKVTPFTSKELPPAVSANAISNASHSRLGKNVISFCVSRDEGRNWLEPLASSVFRNSDNSLLLPSSSSLVCVFFFIIFLFKVSFYFSLVLEFMIKFDCIYIYMCVCLFVRLDVISSLLLFSILGSVTMGNRLEHFKTNSR